MQHTSSRAYLDDDRNPVEVHEFEENGDERTVTVRREDSRVTVVLDGGDEYEFELLGELYKGVEAADDFGRVVALALMESGFLVKPSYDE